jgi:hypothetical protein
MRSCDPIIYCSVCQFIIVLSSLNVLPFASLETQDEEVSSRIRPGNRSGGIKKENYIVRQPSCGVSFRWIKTVRKTAAMNLLWRQARESGSFQ